MPRTKHEPEKDLFMGCDPGVSGCFMLLHRDGSIVDEIRMDQTLLDIGKALRHRRREISFALIEKVHSGVFSGASKMGVKSAFTFGDANGVMRGMVTVCGIRHEYVRAQEWQQVLNCRTKGDKNVTKARAQELFPDYKIVHRNADALLLAELARRKGQERGY